MRLVEIRHLLSPGFSRAIGAVSPVCSVPTGVSGRTQLSRAFCRRQNRAREGKVSKVSSYGAHNGFIVFATRCKNLPKMAAAELGAGGGGGRVSRT